METLYIKCLIPMSVLQNDKLTSLEKLILIHMISFSKKNDMYCWGLINTFAIFIKLVDRQYLIALIIWLN